MSTNERKKNQNNIFYKKNKMNTNLIKKHFRYEMDLTIQLHLKK